MRTCTFSFLAFAAALASAQSTNPVINSTGGIVNAADYQNPIAPGSLFSIFGSRLSSQTASALTIPLSTSLGGVTVQFVSGSTTINAPMLYVQPDGSTPGSSQINAQVPWELAAPGAANTTVNVVVSHDGVSSAPTPVTIGPFSPGIFASGTQAIAVNLDGTLAWPANSVAGLTTHPASPGSTIILYATGLGAVNQTIPDGAISGSVLAQTLTIPTVMVGGMNAQVQFSGLAPQFVGVNQLNVVVPNVPAGNAIPIQIQVGGITSPSTITMAVN
jgi:minor extracellular serine protease Vpr